MSKHPPRRLHQRSDPTQLQPGDVEMEMGIPIPGTILPKGQWVQTAVKRLPETGTIDVAALFQRSAPLAIDIGCGNGRFAISSAVRRPDWNHIAIDILPTVVRYGTRRGNQRGLSNLRFAVCDGWRFLQMYLEPGSVNEFHIYHPQPFANLRSKSPSSGEASAEPETEPMGKHRLFTPGFLSLLHSRLTDDGAVYLQSDNTVYWDHIQKNMSQLFDWRDVDQPWPEDPNGRSRREVIAMEQGLAIHRGIASKRAGLSAESVAAIVSELQEPDFEIAGSPENGARKSRFRRRFPKHRRRS